MMMTLVMMERTVKNKEKKIANKAGKREYPMQQRTSIAARLNDW
jgi:hypothetical protein